MTRRGHRPAPQGTPCMTGQGGHPLLWASSPGPSQDRMSSGPTQQPPLTGGLGAKPTKGRAPLSLCRIVSAGSTCPGDAHRDSGSAGLKDKKECGWGFVSSYRHGEPRGQTAFQGLAWQLGPVPPSALAQASSYSVPFPLSRRHSTRCSRQARGRGQ